MAGGLDGYRLPGRKPQKRRHGHERTGGFGMPDVPPKKKNAFGNKQKVKGGVEQRARKRLKAVGGVKGVNPKDGITRREARKVRRSWNRQGRPGGGNPNRPNRPNRPQKPQDPYSQDVNLYAQLEYGAQERELERERAIGVQQQANQRSWYDQYQKDLAARSQMFNAFTQGQVQGQQAATLQAGIQDSQFAKALQEEEMRSAAQRGFATPGTGVGPHVAQPQVQPLQQAAASRTALATSLNTAQAMQGQAQAGYFAAQPGIAFKEGMRSLQDEQNRARELNEIGMDMAREKGQFKRKARQELEEAEWQKRLEAQAFGLDAYKAKQDARDDRADNRRDRRKDRVDARDKRADNRRERRENRWDRRQDQAKNRLDRDKYNLDVRKEQRMRDQDLADDGRVNGSSGGSKGLSESERDKLATSIRRLRRAKAKPSEKQAMLDVLINDGGVPPRIARAAWKRYQRSLRKKGIGVGGGLGGSTNWAELGRR